MFNKPNTAFWGYIWVWLSLWILNASWPTIAMVVKSVLRYRHAEGTQTWSTLCTFVEKVGSASSFYNTWSNGFGAFFYSNVIGSHINQNRAIPTLPLKFSLALLERFFCHAKWPDFLNNVYCICACNPVGIHNERVSLSPEVSLRIHEGEGSRANPRASPEQNSFTGTLIDMGLYC